MDQKAYHLQRAAHRATALAIKAGRLVRQPCEVCGGAGQAHHDSYYPDKWLDVRWLCGTHHREWHQHHQPLWPSIFEYHPSDDPAYFVEASEAKQKPGRPPRPWFRTSRGLWYVNYRGKAHNLGPDRDDALLRFRELTGGTEWGRNAL